jgi:wyosine [tRNA(Phe)-imidazoG37] synthetase (radical SAM superfamily)
MKGFSHVPPELLQLKDVALSGEGEPTLCPNFHEVVRELVRIRANPQFSKFRLVLITNATGLSLKTVRDGLALFEPTDEIWAKLDAGTQEYLELVNRSRVPLKQVLANIGMLAALRPVVIQSLFCAIEGKGPDENEINEYSERLHELVQSGARIDRVQIYSVTRDPGKPGICSHLPLAALSNIARKVREKTGLKVEVY